MNECRYSEVTLNRLLPFSKICSVLRGEIDGKPNNLQEILDRALLVPKVTMQTPVAILAVVGPEGSGKSLFTNFLIQYLRCGCEGSWWTAMKSQNEQGRPIGPGFSWGRVIHPKLFLPDTQLASSSGIYLWPEPFLMERSDQETILVWVMHYVVGGPDATGDVADLERFLTMACSRVMEIEWNNADKFRTLEQTWRLLSTPESQQEPHSISPEEICNSFVYVVRSPNKTLSTTSSSTDEEAKRELRALIRESGMTSLDSKVLDHFQHVNVTWLQDSAHVLHGEDGIFDQTTMNNLNRTIKHVVSTMMQESEIVPKRVGTGIPLTLGEMPNFLWATAVKLTSRKRMDLEIGKTFPEIKTCVGEETLESNTSTEGQSEGNTELKLLETSIDEEGYDGVAPPKQNDDTAKKNIEEKIDEVTKGKEDSNYPTSAETTTTSVVSQSLETSSSTVISPPERNEQENVKTNYYYYQEDVSQSVHVFGQTTALLRVTLPKECDVGDKDELWLSQSHNPEMAPISVVGETTEAEKNTNDDGEVTAMEVEELPEGTTVEDMEMDVCSTEVEDISREMECDGMTDNREALEKGQEVLADWDVVLSQKAEEEKQHQKQEEAAGRMREYLEQAVIDIMQALGPNTERWIKTNITRAFTIQELPTIFDHIYARTLRKYKNKVDETFWGEFEHSLKLRCKPECQGNLLSVYDIVSKLKEAIHLQFRSVVYFAHSPVLETWATEKCGQLLTGKESQFVCEMTTLAAEGLGCHYREQNDRIREIEKNLYKAVMSELIGEYHEVMGSVMANAPYRSDQLRNVHGKLTNELVNVLKLSAGALGNGNVDEMMVVEIQTLREDLDQAFLTHREANKTKLNSMHKMTSKIIASAKGEYTENIEAVLKRYPNGVNEQNLVSHNKAIASDAVKMLESEIVSNVRSNEPLEGHRKVVLTYVAEYWPAVEAENKKRLAKKEEEDQEKREKNKREAKLQLEQTQNNGERSSRDSTTAATSAQRTATGSLTACQPPGPLPPLIFHLQSQEIVMAVVFDGVPHLQANEWEELRTPAAVRLDPQTKELIYGTEAVAEAAPESVWSIADIWTSGDVNWYKYLCLGGKNERITIDFLLAFLFRKLKHTVEDRLNGKFSTTLIAIPYWLSSLQRVQIRDAAEMAGFSSSYLINESSAAAYNFVTGSFRTRRSSKALIVSECCDRFDAFVYWCEGSSKKVKMLAQASTYHQDDDLDGDEEERKKDRTTKVFRQLRKMMHCHSHSSRNGYNPDDLEVMKTVSSSIQTACDKVVRRFRKEQADMFETLIVSSNSKWRGLVAPILKKIGKKPRDIDGVSAVMRGMAAMSNNPEDIGDSIRDLLAYDVLCQNVFSQKVVVAVPARQLLPAKLGRCAVALDPDVNAARFHQDVLGVIHPVVDVNCTHLPVSHTLEPNLEITNEGIVRHRGAMTKADGTATLKHRVDPAHVQWTTNNLHPDRMKELKKLLNRMVKPPPSSHSEEEDFLADRKAELATTCEGMINRINGGSLLEDKSNFIKKQVLQLLSDAKGVGQSATCTLEQVQGQWDVVDRLSNKYDQPKQETTSGN